MDRKTRKNVEGDRLSNLPDELIHKVFFSIDIKDAISTSALSSRWRFVWTTLPYLNFSSEDFSGPSTFNKFVSRVLRHHNYKIDVYSLKLKLTHDIVREGLFKKLLLYAISHNVQQLTVSCLFEKSITFPLHLFCSKSLKHLRLTGGVSSSFCSVNYSTLGKDWKLSALTTLHLDYIKFNGDDTLLLSKCPNLKVLTLNHFRTKKRDPFCICHPQISSLTLENGDSTLEWKCIDVVAPQLENLHIINCYGRYKVSAPHLASLLFKGYKPLQFSEDDMCSLEKVHLCTYHPKCYGVGANEIVALLQRLRNGGANVEEGEKVSISTEVRNYLLDSSPSATLRIVSHETLRAYRNAKSARTLMSRLWTMLEDEKNSKNSMPYMDQRNAIVNRDKAKMHEQEIAQVENQRAQPFEKMETHISEMMGQIKSSCEDLGLKVDQGRAKTVKIISTLQEIKMLLTKLPASKKDKLQAEFSNLCVETDTVVKRIIDRVKIQYDEKHSHVIDCFHKLTSQPDRLIQEH
uniref:putative F-box/LRR-repeat protein At4g15060 n=1 Tax=Erigeron canadensis TaxID=72917 RepID=UPI001CB9B92E|nr:putative F-box/LRR-repeat protein At4g15060 [Erigeron canadensis]